MDSSNVKCYICGCVFDYQERETCPVCDWIWLGWENELDENEKTDANPISIREAKQNFAKGLDIWGDPIKK